jgi:methionyl-tRNA formyltransferase
VRLVFFGSPAISVPTLEALVNAGHEVLLVVTQADKRRGRGNHLSATPVKTAAESLGLPVSHRVKDALTVPADLGVLVAFGRIIKPEILAELTILNLHPSLLPRWRGATPAEAAILAGDTKTGISIMQLQAEMDAGPIYARHETEIEDGETAGALYRRLMTAGNELLTELLQRPELPTPSPQSGEPTYCGKLTPEQFHINWGDKAVYISRLLRIGRVWTTFRGKRLLIIEATADPHNASDSAFAQPGSLDSLRVRCGDGWLQLRKVQPEGKPVMDAAAWVNGAQPTQGERLGH